MRYLVLVLACGVVAACSAGSVQCKHPSMFEPIAHCEDCIWNAD